MNAGLRRRDSGPRLERPLLQVCALFGVLGACVGTARAEVRPAEPLRIWYRSSDACPEGSAFIARLRDLGRDAALAGVGDRIDFVVTLASSAEGSSGRLERQTERGTVALRELRAASCEEVAEGLALTLELTLAPPAENKPENNQEGKESSVSPPVRANRVADLGAWERVASHGEPERSAFPLQLGAHAGLASGIAPNAAFAGDIFVAFDHWLRFRAIGAYGRGTSQAGATPAKLGVRVLGARLDSCPLGVQADRFSVYPCLGVELGVLSAWSTGESAYTDHGLWAGALVSGRAGLRLSQSLWAELELGARVPWVRYTVATSAGTELFRTPVLGVEAALGLRWAP